MIENPDAGVVTFLKSVPVFHDLKGGSLERLFEVLEQETWAPGQKIFAEGDVSRMMYILREGEVEVLRNATSGAAVPIVRLGPGETFGEMTLVELQPRSATVIARRKTVTYSLTNLDLWNLYQADNYAYVVILQNICRMVSRRLRKADSRIADFLDGKVEVGQKSSGKAAKKPAKKAGKKK
jgi:CRP-like cAMP-binding protein